MARFVPSVFKVLLYDTSTGEAFGTGALSSANVDFSAAENEIRGGYNNALQAVFHSDRNVEFSFTDVKWEMDILAAQLGQTKSIGAQTVRQLPKVYTAGTDGDITLDETPTDIDSLSVYKDGAKLTKTTDYTLTGAVLSPVTASWAEGDEIDVRTYTYTSDANTEQIVIDAQTFPGGFETVLKTPVLNDCSDIVGDLLITFGNAVPMGNFSISTTAESTGTDQTYSMKVTKGCGSDSTEMGTIRYIPRSA